MYVYVYYASLCIESGEGGKEGERERERGREGGRERRMGGRDL